VSTYEQKKEAACSGSLQKIERIELENKKRPHAGSSDFIKPVIN
jgi:hypothetical protein